jgi:hypothetical protein
MKESAFLELREQKLNELKRRFSNTLVTMAMSCKSGAGVRHSLENMVFFVEDYARFLDETIVEEDINEPEPDGQRERDGIPDGGCARDEADGKPERTAGVTGESSGDQGAEAEGGQKRA